MQSKKTLIAEKSAEKDILYNNIKYLHLCRTVIYYGDKREVLS